MVKRLALVAVLAACGHAQKLRVAPAIAASLEVRWLAFAGDQMPRDLAVCTPGAALVTTDGGVTVAGGDDWVIPGGTGIAGIDCDEAGDTFVLRGAALWNIPRTGGESRELATLAGDLHVASSVDPVAWVWGKLASNRYALYRYDSENGVQQVIVTDTPIDVVAPAGADSAIAAIGRSVILLARGQEPQVIRSLGARADGLAVAGDGALYVSQPDGVLRLTAHDSQKVLAGVHGPLRVRHDTLWVLFKEQRTVAWLAPKSR